jgi:predicted signal transduction protein with EAL and GGDEF domain
MITPIGAQPATAEALVGRLFDTVVGDVEVNGHDLRISISVGISVSPGDGMDASTLLSNADAALYRGKKEGRDTFRFFDAAVDRPRRERNVLQHELRVGIAHEELVLHYQPQARMTGEIIGFEALIRWQHPTPSISRRCRSATGICRASCTGCCSRPGWAQIVSSSRSPRAR